MAIETINQVLFGIACFLLVFGSSLALWFSGTSNDAEDIDALAHEAKIATKNYIAALNDATGLIKTSYPCTVSMKRSRHASRFIRARQRSTSLRNGIRALKNRTEQVHAIHQSP